jgi:uncharacterized integral membrane protein
MKGKMIFFLVILVIALLFMWFNRDNHMSVNLGVYSWNDVSVSIGMLFSFALGILLMVPFLVRLGFSSRKSRKEVRRLGKQAGTEEQAGAQEEPGGPEHPAEGRS